jgi:PTS system nitrogen regulatory IIA component
MKIADVLEPDHTYCNVPGVSKKRVLENLASFLSEDKDFATDTDAIYQKLLEREKLGSTGIGSGVAIPHCRVAGCNKITGVLLKLNDSIDFDATDGEPVDLVFALVVPEEQTDEHLQALSAIAELLESPDTRARLRAATSDEELYDLATSAEPT